MTFFIIVLYLHVNVVVNFKLSFALWKYNGGYFSKTYFIAFLDVILYIS